MSFTGKRLISAAPTGGLEGEVLLASPQADAVGTWTVPDGVYSISVITVDAGVNGGLGYSGSAQGPGNGGPGGPAGPVYYRNSIPVTPGQQFSYRVGVASTTAIARRSIFGDISTRPAEFSPLVIPGETGGESGGRGSTTTYESGYGGRSSTGVSVTNPLGVPLALNGTRNPGTTTGTGAGANGLNAIQDYGGGGGGGGGGARLDNAPGGSGGNGRRGCIRIVWPGESRQFPYDAA